MNKLILFFLTAVTLYASVESEVDAVRFSHNGEVLTDNFSSIQWQDNREVQKNKKTQSDINSYCINLRLNEHKDWRLPSIVELKYAYTIKRQFINISKNSYWSSSTDSGIQAWELDFKDGNNYYGKSDTCYIRCIRGKQFNKKDIIKEYVKKVKFPKIKKINTVYAYIKFIKEYPYSQEAIKSLYTLIKKQNNIAGYEWYIKNYPKSKQAKDAIKNIHKLAFAKAQQLNTISSLNTFIISYPYAKEIKETVDISYKLETKKYKIIEKDDEKKARLLAVRIKKMTIRMKKQNNTIGYEIVIDRMSKLLTEAYEETDASLRYYESKEFTQFASKFDTTMKNIQSVLSEISGNTANLGAYMQDMINISRQGYADDKSDRAMTAHYEAQKTEWDKTMHLFDKGYR